MPFSNLQPRLFEVEVAFYAVHSLVADPALVTQSDQGRALRPKQLPHQALVVNGAVLQPVLVAVEACGEPASAEVVEPTQPLGRILAHPLLLGQLLYARQRSLSYLDPSQDLLLLSAPIVLEPQRPDQGRQAQALHH